MNRTDFDKLGTPIDISKEPVLKEEFGNDELGRMNRYNADMFKAFFGEIPPFPVIIDPANPDYDTRADEAKEKLLQDAIAAIRDDSDRVKAIIVENADIIQDIYFGCSRGMIDENRFAVTILGLINRKIEYCAESDIEKLLPLGAPEEK